MRGGLNSIQDRGDASGRVPGASLFCILGVADHGREGDTGGGRSGREAASSGHERALAGCFQEKRGLKDRGVKPVYLIQYKDG